MQSAVGHERARRRLPKRLVPRILVLVLGVTVAMRAAGFDASLPRLDHGEPIRGFPSPGDKPEGLAWDGQHLWCNNFTDGSLFKLNVADGSVAAHYRGGLLPRAAEGLAWDGEHLWTCDWFTGVITKLREVAGGIEIVGQFDKPAGSGNSVGLEWDGSSLWLSCFPGGQFERGQLYKLDAATLEVLWMTELPVYWIEDLAWDGRYLWSSDWLFGVGFAIDPASGDTLHTYAPPGPNPVGMAWDGTHLWVTDTAKDSIWALDISEAQAVRLRHQAWGDVKRTYRE